MLNSVDDFPNLCQLAIAYDLTDRYDRALAMLAATRESEFDNRMRIARVRMKKYDIAYGALAKL